MGGSQGISSTPASHPQTNVHEYYERYQLFPPQRNLNACLRYILSLYQSYFGHVKATTQHLPLCSIFRYRAVILDSLTTKARKDNIENIFQYQYNKGARSAPHGSFQLVKISDLERLKSARQYQSWLFLSSELV